MKYITNIGVALLLLITSGCGNSSDSSKTAELYLNHYKSECNSFELAMCLQSRINENDEWSYLNNPIEGFDYEWGYNYKVRVKIEEIDNPPEDASSLTYTLLEIIEKIKEPTTTLFNVAVSRTNGLIEKESEKIYTIYNDKEIECIDADCETIDSLIAQDKAILFEVKHQTDTEGPLLLEQIKCSSSRDSFRDSCI